MAVKGLRRVEEGRQRVSGWGEGCRPVFDGRPGESGWKGRIDVMGVNPMTSILPALPQVGRLSSSLRQKLLFALKTRTSARAFGLKSQESWSPLPLRLRSVQAFTRPSHGAGAPLWLVEACPPAHARNFRGTRPLPGHGRPGPAGRRGGRRRGGGNGRSPYPGR